MDWGNQAEPIGRGPHRGAPLGPPDGADRHDNSHCPERRTPGDARGATDRLPGGGGGQNGNGDSPRPCAPVRRRRRTKRKQLRNELQADHNNNSNNNQQDDDNDISNYSNTDRSASSSSSLASSSGSAAARRSEDNAKREQQEQEDYYCIARRWQLAGASVSGRGGQVHQVQQRTVLRLLVADRSAGEDKTESAPGEGGGGEKARQVKRNAAATSDYYSSPSSQQSTPVITSVASGQRTYSRRACRRRVDAAEHYGQVKGKSQESKPSTCSIVENPMQCLAEHASRFADCNIDTMLDPTRQVTMGSEAAGDEYEVQGAWASSDNGCGDGSSGACVAGDSGSGLTGTQDDNNHIGGGGGGGSCIADQAPNNKRANPTQRRSAYGKIGQHDLSANLNGSNCAPINDDNGNVHDDSPVRQSAQAQHQTPATGRPDNWTRQQQAHCVGAATAVKVHAVAQSDDPLTSLLSFASSSSSSAASGNGNGNGHCRSDNWADEASTGNNNNSDNNNNNTNSMNPSKWLPPKQYQTSEQQLRQQQEHRRLSEIRLSNCRPQVNKHHQTTTNRRRSLLSGNGTDDLDNNGTHLDTDDFSYERRAERPLSGVTSSCVARNATSDAATTVSENVYYRALGQHNNLMPKHDNIKSLICVGSNDMHASSNDPFVQRRVANENDYYCVPEQSVETKSNGSDCNNLHESHYYQSPSSVMISAKDMGTGAGADNCKQPLPLIRSDSWQHKTRIDFHNQWARAPVERQQQQRAASNYYNGMATLLANETAAGRQRDMLQQQQNTMNPSSNSNFHYQPIRLFEGPSEKGTATGLRPHHFQVGKGSQQTNGYVLGATPLVYSSEFGRAPSQSPSSGLSSDVQVHRYTSRRNSKQIRATSKQKASGQCLALVALFVCASAALACALILSSMSSSRRQKIAANSTFMDLGAGAAGATHQHSNTDDPMATRQNTQLMAPNGLGQAKQIPIGSSAANEFGRVRQHQQQQLLQLSDPILLHTNETAPATITTQWDHWRHQHQQQFQRQSNSANPTAAGSGPTPTNSPAQTTSRQPEVEQTVPSDGGAFRVLSSPAPHSLHSLAALSTVTVNGPLKPLRSCDNGKAVAAWTTTSQPYGKCLCAKGFSGVACSTVGCPNGCSNRGTCELRPDSPFNAALFAASDQVMPADPTDGIDASIGFETDSGPTADLAECIEAVSRTRNGSSSSSSSSNGMNLNLNQRPQQQQLWDNRLEWACKCSSGFVGPDCSEQSELQCDDGVDNDSDGLVDCEDDDCCMQAACKDNLMCFKSPEPRQVLESMRQQSIANPFDDHPTDGSSSGSSSGNGSGNHSDISPDLDATSFAQWRFLIANGSVQSYALDKFFDRRRIAVVRGRVLKCRPTIRDTDDAPSSAGKPATSCGHSDGEGIVSVRVSVLEHSQFGFTLSRQDGHFDLLLNGDEWVTLQFHRNAYVPLKVRVFARAKRINTLPETVALALSPTAAANTVAAGEPTLATPLDGSTSEATNGSSAAQHERHQQLPYELPLRAGLSALVGQLVAQSGAGAKDDSLRTELFTCLWDKIHQQTTGTVSANSDDNRCWHSANEPLIADADQTGNKTSWRSFALAGGEAAFRAQVSLAQATPDTGADSPDPLTIGYNSAAVSAAKPLVVFDLVQAPSSAKRSGSDSFRLKSIEVQLSIEGQWRRARLSPRSGLAYKFAWDRRNVYGQKVYGFGELIARFGYEYEFAGSGSDDAADTGIELEQYALNECLVRPPTQVALAQMSPHRQMQLTAAANAPASIHQVRSLMLQARSRPRTVWFERRVFMEAFAMNQHADIGRGWNLIAANRLDVGRDLIYFGSGWQLPFRLAYPLTLSPARPLMPSGASGSTPMRRTLQTDKQQRLWLRSDAADASSPRYQFPAHLSGAAQFNQQQQQQSHPSPQLVARSMARGPNSSVFVARLVTDGSAQANRLLQLDSTGSPRLIDVPLAILMSKLGPQQQQQQQRQQRPTPQQLRSDVQLAYNNQQAVLYISSFSGQRIVQVSYASLLALNKTLAGDSATLSAEDEIDIEPLCGLSPTTTATTTSTTMATVIATMTGAVNSRAARFEQANAAGAVSGAMTPCSQLKLQGPHSMTLDEHRQVLYFVDGQAKIVAMDLNTHQAALVWPAAAAKTAAPNGPLLRGGVCRDGRYRWGPGTAASADYAAEQIHSLSWVQADSSLYFVDRGSLFALRQDSSIELIVAGGAKGNNGCAAATTYGPVGHIEMIASDFANIDELLVVHRRSVAPVDNIGQVNNIKPNQWHSTVDDEASNSKVDRYFVAKLRLGVQTAPTSSSLLIDMHSADWAWSSLVRRLAAGALADKGRAKTSIDWPLLAERAPTNNKHSQTIPFIHLALADGFDRIDSIEINSEGSIFVLNSIDHSIRLLEPYSPLQFNLADGNGRSGHLSRSAAQLSTANSSNNRLFVSEPFSSTITTTQTETTTTQQPFIVDRKFNRQGGDYISGSNTNSKTSSIIVRNPITNEPMEFHPESGLQLGLTAAAADSSARLDFRYRVVAVQANRIIAANRIGLSQPIDLVSEDDRNDLDARRIASRYVTKSHFDDSNASQSIIRIGPPSSPGHLDDADRSPSDNDDSNIYYIRLARIIDSTRRQQQQFEFVRTIATNHRPLLQYITKKDNNSFPICQLRSDYRFGALLTAIQMPNQPYWTEFQYEPNTYLLRDISTRPIGTSPSPIGSQQQTIFGPNKPINVDNTAIDSSYRTTKLKKVVYDRLYGHYCDLISVNV